MIELKISIIIPCYNEQEVISYTYNRLKEVFKGEYKNYELIFVNDGSKDNTLPILNSIALQDSCVKIISFSRNFGHQPAVTAGINNCIGDVAIIIDADLQDPPEIIPEMIQMHLNEGCSVVYGVRLHRKGETFFKKLSARWYYALINKMSDIELPRDTGDFRLIDKKVIEEFKKLPEKAKYIRGLITWVGFKQMPIYYNREARLIGETKYPLSRMIKFATTGLLYFTKKPLSISIAVGLLSILVGIILTFYITISKFLHPENIVQGWTSLIVIIIFFGGIQLLSVGVLGKYLGSIFDEVKNRPEYIIDQKINF